MTTIGFSVGAHFAHSPDTEDRSLAGLTTLTGPAHGSVGLFDAALNRAVTAGGAERAATEPAVKVAAVADPARVAQAGPATATDAAPAPGVAVSGSGAAERERARRALELDAPATPPAAAQPGGDAIIEGLQKLRGVFDERNARLNSIMSAKSVDVGTLMAMQMELVRFSLLVEVTSKLTGKSTQAFDTLMKGQ